MNGVARPSSLPRESQVWRIIAPRSLTTTELRPAMIGEGGLARAAWRGTTGSEAGGRRVESSRGGRARRFRTCPKTTGRRRSRANQPSGVEPEPHRGCPCLPWQVVAGSQTGQSVVSNAATMALRIQQDVRDAASGRVVRAVERHSRRAVLALFETPSPCGPRARGRRLDRHPLFVCTYSYTISRGLLGPGLLTSRHCPRWPPPRPGALPRQPLRPWLHAAKGGDASGGPRWVVTRGGGT